MIIKTEVHYVHVQKNMRHLKDALRTELPRIHDTLANMVFTKSQEIVPVDTGRLKNSLMVKRRSTQLDAISSWIGSPLRYAKNVELGGPRNTPRHYLRRGLEETTAARTKYFKTEVERILKDAEDAYTPREKKAPSFRSSLYKTARLAGHVEAITGVSIFPRAMMYKFAKLQGDVSAFRKSSVGTRFKHRVLGRATGKAIGKLTPAGGGAGRVSRRATRIAGARVTRRIIH